MLCAMVVIRGLVAALALAALVAAALVIKHGSPVKDAGQALGYVAPVQPNEIAVIGDSYSSGTDMGGDATSDACTQPGSGQTCPNWAVELAAINRIGYDGA